MFDIIGVCTGLGDPKDILCQFKVGSDKIDLSKKGKSFYVLLNNRAVLSAKTEKDLLSQTVPVLSRIIGFLARKAQLDNFRWKRVNRSYTPLIDDVIKNVSDNARTTELFISEMAPDEILENIPAELQASVSNKEIKLEAYLKSLKNFGETIDLIRHGSEIILRTNLDRNIWGSKKIMSSFASIKEKMASIKEDFETVESYIEKTGDLINKVNAAINKKIAKDTVVLGKVIENFTFIKSFISRLAQITQNIYDIDGMFKEAVGYPATWFLDGSVFIPFLYEHENLVEHIVKAAAIESEIIEPLLVWKIGDGNVR